MLGWYVLAPLLNWLKSQRQDWLRGHTKGYSGYFTPVMVDIIVVSLKANLCLLYNADPILSRISRPPYARKKKKLFLNSEVVS